MILLYSALPARHHLIRLHPAYIRSKLPIKNKMKVVVASGLYRFTFIVIKVVLLCHISFPLFYSFSFL